tara:strand:- start:1979 stop:2446 length:468 start_codon:yes stop_codon:yes gene_type:complete
MKLIPLALLLLAGPAMAGGPRVNYQSTGDYSNYKAYRDYKSDHGFASENICYRYEYREEYIPGNSRRPGYVSSYREKVEVPCAGQGPKLYDLPEKRFPDQLHHDEDGNDCSQGAVLGGITGGAAGAALSRGDGRWWAIPLGIVGGAVVGCDIDGG